MTDRVLSMLGIAAKAGCIVSGEFSVESAVKTGAAYLVIISKDASENTRKKFLNMTSFYEVPAEIYGSKEELGRAIGKEFRVTCAVTDERLAQTLEKKIADGKLNN